MPTTTAELAELIARVARGDRAAFKAVYAATSSKLFGIAVRILGRKEVAEEVLQEVYVKVWERAGEFDPARASPITWMATITRNRALDEVRRRAPVSIEDTPEALEIADTGEDALAQLARNEDGRRLLECIGKLEPQRREVVLLAYYQGMSREALGQRFGRPVATIKTWLHRSLAQLRQCLGE
jgi:RNA polymerase sigma-70 factor (ECF subfamily)